MRVLGELVALGVFPAVAWTMRFVIRDVLDHLWKRRVLKRVPDNQVADVVRALGAKRPNKRN